MFDPHKPYNALKPLPPDRELETRTVLKKCITARTALMELKTAGALIPDQSVLIHTIPMLEARDSSEIENIVTSGDALYRGSSLPDEETDPATKEARRYRTALFQGFGELGKRPVSTRLAVEICQTIKGTGLDVRATPGTALANAHTGEIIYTPPEGQDRLRNLLQNWEEYLNAGDAIDPLVRMAIQHYQFEAIHPFTDGNGRTGRVLNILAVVQAGLLDTPTLYLSRSILQTRGTYYDALLNVTRTGAWEPWILYILDTVESSSIWTTGKINAIRGLMENTSGHIHARLPKIHSHGLITALFSMPYCRIADLVEAGIAKRQTASSYLKQLTAIGVLEEEKVGRDKLYLNRRYLDLLLGDEHDFRTFDPEIGNDIKAE